MQHTDEDVNVESEDAFDEAELFSDLPDPPHGVRFGEGQPINRQGRPRGSPNLATIVRRVALKRHRVKIEGKIRRKNTVELVMLAIRRKAAQQDVRALKLMQSLIEKVSPRPPKRQGVLISCEKLTSDEWDAVYGYDMTDADVDAKVPYMMKMRKRHQGHMRESARMASESMHSFNANLEPSD